MTTTQTNNTRTPASTDRVPPQDLEAEMALLGSMMMSRDAIAEVIPLIRRADSEWFYLPVHRRLFEVLLDLYDDPTKAIDLIVVSDELRRRDLLDYVGGQDYLVQLAESFADWANAEFYARIVRDKGMLRDLIRCAGEITELAYSGIDEPRDILDAAEQKLFSATERRVTGHAVAIREEVARLAQQLRDGVPCTGLRTAFGRFNEMTGGLHPGDLVVLAGRPSMGKTALGLTLSKHLAMDEHHGVAFFSMEMSAEQLAARLACSHKGIDLQKYRLRKLSEEEKAQFQYAAADFQEVPLFIDDTPGMTAIELRAKARRLKQRENIDVVFVDYLQLMYLPKAESRQVEIATISRQLKGLARELHIPVVALAQLNRMPEGRQDKRPLMSDLRESGAIEQDADVVLLIHREEFYKPEDEEVKGKAELIIAKQRNGPTGTIELQFNKKLTRFSNLSLGPESYGFHAVSYDMAADSVPF
ncbi:MAG: replicative DNA helicase [Phycisphaerae bacterium]